MEFLPDTLLELIFEMTGDVYSLRDLLFVCNRFREVILGSSLLMKKLPIEFRESDDIFLNKHHAIVQNILKESCKIQEVLIEGNVRQIPVAIREKMESLRFLKSINEKVKTSVQISKFRLFVNMAFNLKNIFCRELEQIEYDGEYDSIPKQLDRLEILDRHCCLLDENLQTKQLVVDFENDDKNPENIAAFIESQYQLKSLELRSFSINTFKLRSKLKFQLDELTVIGMKSNEEANTIDMKSDFVMFVKNQNLKRFKIRDSSFDELLHLMLTEMNELETLKLAADSLSSTTFVNPNMLNTNVTTLILEQHYSEEILNFLLSCVPNVVSLRCSFTLTDLHLKHVSSNLTKLIYFSIESFSSNMDFSSIHSFPPVRKLVVDTIRFADYNKENWKYFALKFSELFHLIFKQGPYTHDPLLYETVLIFMSNMLNMKILEIGGEQVNRDVLEIIANDPHHLKIFKFEGGHGTEDGMHELFKNTELLVSVCPSIYFEVKYNRYEKNNSFCSDDDWNDNSCEFDEFYNDLESEDSDFY